MSKTETAPKEVADKHPKPDLTENDKPTESPRDRLLWDALDSGRGQQRDDVKPSVESSSTGDVKSNVDKSSTGDVKSNVDTSSMGDVKSNVESSTRGDAKPDVEPKLKPDGKPNDGLPQVELTQEPPRPSDVTPTEDSADSQGTGGDSKRTDNFEYKTQPSETTVAADQKLGTLATSLAPEFYGDAYPVYAQDPFVLKQFEKAFAQALAFANNLQPDATVLQGSKLTIPGRNSEGEPLFAKDGIKRQWGSNTVDTLEKDGTRRTQFDDGTTYVYKTDGTSTVTDVLGMTETRKTLPDGTFETTRSDGSWEKKFKDGSSESFSSSNGMRTHVAPDGTTTSTFKNGEVSMLKPDGTETFIAPDKSVTETGKDFSSRTVDKDAHLIGLGVFRQEIAMTFQPDEDPKRNSVMRGRGRPDWNFTLSTDKGGDVKITEGEPPRTLRAVNDGDYKTLGETREKLFQHAEKNYDDPLASAKLKADLIRFENRAKERGLSADAVLDVYKNLDKLLTPNAHAKVNDKGRAQIAAELAGDLANPYSVSQGKHGTCNVKILQVVMSAKHPERVAGIITEAALTGKHTLPSGDVVTLPEGTLTPHNDAIGYPNRNGARGFAGQLFDSAAVNTLLQLHKMPYRFDQLDPDPSLKGYKTGDIMVNNGTDKPLINPATGEVMEFNGLHTRDIVEVYKQIMGATKSNEDWLLDAHFGKGDTVDGIKAFESPKELSSILKDLKEQGKFPFPIHVDTRMAPFWADSNGGLAGGSGGAHVLNIADYDPATNSVLIDNQWSSFNDRLDASKAVPVDQLFAASVNNQALLSRIKSEAADKAGDDGELRDRLVLRDLNNALKDSDPNVLSTDYRIYSGELGNQLAATTRGEPANVEVMNIYRSLSPIGKLEALLSVAQDATTSGGAPKSFSPEEYKNDVVQLANEFGMSIPFIIRGLQTRPETIPDGLRAHVIMDVAPGRDAYNKGRLDVVELFARMPESTRVKMLEHVQTDFERREREAKEFAAKYAE